MRAAHRHHDVVHVAVEPVLARQLGRHGFAQRLRAARVGVVRLARPDGALERLDDVRRVSKSGSPRSRWMTR